MFLKFVMLFRQRSYRTPDASSACTQEANIPPRGCAAPLCLQSLCFRYRQETTMSGNSQFDQRARYDALMDVVRNRMTTRQFDPNYVVPREHYELILEAARHGPSGANAQPWHYIVVTKPELKKAIAGYFVEEQRLRAKVTIYFTTP